MVGLTYCFENEAMCDEEPLNLKQSKQRVNESALHGEHQCYWMRRKESLFFYANNTLYGVGVPASVLRSMAKRQDVRFVETTKDDYRTSIVMGSVVRGVMQGCCSFSLQPISARMKVAFLQTLLDLHCYYAGITAIQEKVPPALLDVIDTGTMIYLRTNSKRKSLTFYNHALESGFFARLRAPRTRLQFIEGIGVT
jgi:hypothetical protein